MKRFLLVLAIASLGSSAAATVSYYAQAIQAPGPNTVGEAGKVFFAKRFQAGDPIFLPADEPPYYPSVHGALLHASVGALGRWMDASTPELYRLGRLLSLSFTIAGLVLAAAILHGLGVSWRWGALLALAFLGVGRISEHTVSYRADNWVLFLSVLTCALLVFHPRRLWALGLAALLPVLAFFVKAPGIGIALAVFVALFASRQRAQAVAVAASSAALGLVATFALELASGGRFLAGLRGAGGVSFEVEHLLWSLNVPQLWLPLAMPLLLLGQLRDAEGEAGRRLRVVTVFWAVTFANAALAATRTGSNPYYFVETFVFGGVLTLHWLARATQGERAPGVAVTALVVLFCLQGLPVAIPQWVRPARDIALDETLRFQDDREIMAARMNRLAQRSFSDDAGLNVLLERPAVVHPLLQTHMIRAGSLPLEAMVDPVERGEYAMIALTRKRWRYRGRPHLPREFLEAVQRNYVAAATETDYLVLVPRAEVER